LLVSISVSILSLVMGNSFGFLHSSDGGFQFTVVNACEAEGIILNQKCSLVFGNNGALASIGNVTRGTMKPQPGIAGVGIWFAMMVFFGIIAVAVTFVVLELLIRARPYVPCMAGGGGIELTRAQRLHRLRLLPRGATQRSHHRTPAERRHFQSRRSDLRPQCRRYTNDIHRCVPAWLRRPE
jgi:hypothetical protein